MRIAVSGTHFMGKSTLIADFIRAHPDYIAEIEPYYKLQDEDGGEFAQELALEDILDQLDNSIENLHCNANQANIIFDRCPVDFIAYAMYIINQEMVDINDTSIAEKFPQIQEVLENLDLIVFLPITKEHQIDPIDYEDPAYRSTIDRYFKQIYRDEIFDIFPTYDHPKIIEIWGTRMERLKKLEAYL